MAILSWKTSDGQTGQWQVSQPTARIGRAEGNDFTLPDASVSSVHAEFALNGGTLIIRDLGSTNGTFVYDQRVQQAIVESGQRFRLGNVEFSFEQEDLLIQEALPAAITPVDIPLPSLPAIAPATVATAPGNAAGAAPVCFHHPVSSAVFTCTKCRHDLCAACAKQELIGGKRFPFCRHCGGKCVPYGQSAIPQQKRRATFGELLPTAFTYPFKGNGLILLITGSVFFGFLDLITSARKPLSLFVWGYLLSLVVRAIMYGYLFAYMQKIVCASAEGEDEPPSWPEVTDIWQDVLRPFCLFVGVLLASFGPGLFLYVSQPLPGILLMLIGAVYFPMALLAVAMADSIAGVNPLVVFSAILKVPGPYLLSVVACGLLVLLRTWFPPILNQMHLSIISFFPLAGVALFLIMVEMRILGVLYYTNKEKFGWF